MSEKYIIQPYSHHALEHSLQSDHGYQDTHPFFYRVHTLSGDERLLLSKRSDYDVGETIDANTSPTNGLTHRHILDNTPGHVIKSDVILMVNEIKQKGRLVEASGTVFFVAPQMQGYPKGALRDSFKEGAALTVLVASPDRYNLNPGYNTIFANIHDVMVRKTGIFAKAGIAP